MKKIIILVLIGCFVLSCKNNQSSQEKSIDKENIELSKIKKEGNNCFDTLNISLKLPIQGGDNVIVASIEDNIKAVEYKCNFSNDFIKKLCNPENKSLYLLPPKGNIFLAILFDECGDSTHFLLLTFKDNNLVDYITIFHYYEEMSENPVENIVDFKLNEDFELTIYKKELEGKVIKSEEEEKYEISFSGEIIAK